jgi:hypothetical protein
MSIYLYFEYVYASGHWQSRSIHLSYCCTRTVDILRSSFDIEQQIFYPQMEDNRPTVSSDRRFNLIFRAMVLFDGEFEFCKYIQSITRPVSTVA